MSETNSAVESMVAGSLDEGELNQIKQLRQQAEQNLAEIGRLEVRKARIVEALSDIEGKAQAVLDGAVLRIGINKAEPWQITADGKIHVVKPKASEAPASE